MQGAYLVLVAALCTLISCHAASLVDFKDRLESSKSKINEIINKFNQRWEIPSYPNFVQSVAMTGQSWEILKV